MASTKNIQQLTLEEEEAGACALRLASSCALLFTLKAAIELRLLDIIVEAAPGAMLSPVDIAARLPTENPQAATMVDRMLRLLAANSVVSCTVETVADGRPSRKYGAAPLCKYLTKNEDGVSMAALALMQQDKVMVDTWHYLKDSVLEGGIPVKAAYGMFLFDYMSSDSRFSKVFNEGMRSHSSIIIKNLLRVYSGFDDMERLVDVGGNDGATLQMITSRHPHIKGINYDLPRVISGAQPMPGVEHISGDMFEAVPNGDAIFLKCVLHDWSDEDCVKILKNCWKALTENGKVIVVECILPIVPEPTAKAQAVFQLDLYMLVCTNGGRERSEEEFKDLAIEAGFPGFKAAHVFADTWVMEFTK
ncbi:hypothetical protein C4D60_Mb09t20090 [Musa balbisiana]|uniref:O-methyltransferase domain-containing protein n=1 Tax=Musa balbisiana TaxID=52838 RepID=A0A4S8IIG8_MUSBA|nr:hypothetical protein C4D60_Mb09t20090 [Musa balbisiana]